MNIIFYIAFAYITLYGCITFFMDKDKIPRIAKAFMIIASLAAVFILIKYQIVEKKERTYSEYIASKERRDISKKLEEMKEKEEKGLLTKEEYNRYIALHLENINFTLEKKDWNNTREWVIVYYDNVERIPKYYSLEEWKNAEKFIYDSITKEINENFAGRNMYDSSIRKQVLEKVSNERNRLIKAKETQ